MSWNIRAFWPLWMYYIWHSFSSFHIRSFSYLVSLVPVKTCTTPKLSITWLARDSNIIVCTWRNWHTVTTRLLTPMRHATFTPFVTAFTEILSRKGTCHANNHVVMMCYIIIKQVNSLLWFHLTIKHYICTI